MAFDVMLHGGTLVALLGISGGCRASFRGFSTSNIRDRRETRMIISAAVPGLAFGFFGDAIENVLRAPMWVTFGLAFWGIAVWIADVRASKRTKSVLGSGDDVEASHDHWVSQMSRLFPARPFRHYGNGRTLFRIGPENRRSIFRSF